MTIDNGAPVWLDLGTTDLEAAKSFYRDLFGWNFTSTGEDFGGYLMVDVGVPVGGAAPNKNEKGELDPSLPAWFTTYFEVDDIDAATADITAHGGQVFVAPMRRSTAMSSAGATSPRSRPTRATSPTPPAGTPVPASWTAGERFPTASLPTGR